MQSVNLCISIGLLMSLTLIGMIGFKSTILLFVTRFSQQLFTPFLFLPTFELNIFYDSILSPLLAF